MWITFEVLHIGTAPERNPYLWLDSNGSSGMWITVIHIPDHRRNHRYQHLWITMWITSTGFLTLSPSYPQCFPHHVENYTAVSYEAASEAISIDHPTPSDNSQHCSTASTNTSRCECRITVACSSMSTRRCRHATICAPHHLHTRARGPRKRRTNTVQRPPAPLQHHHNHSIIA